MMDIISALAPPVVVAGAFIAIVVAVKRRAEAEARAEDEADKGFDERGPDGP